MGIVDKMIEKDYQNDLLEQYKRRPARKYNEFEKQSNCFRNNMEKYCRRHDGDMSGFFSDGSIYGETESGDWIVGFGIVGNANILVGKDCVKCGGYSSKEFSPMLKKALSDFRSRLENC